ncbi:hypothetical protein CS063_13890 [Sporanaerobium hydrogeniformans]|uniref:Uncharacterized protein n=1 Tax=Sporanaerobium hydrogeniformans TaxID=3072179 RepID=A0AC61D8T5_9FIRM|nr:hypothetical protein [Sporanaerobium hydrogeniformans]PHV69804.1 hypothetical protein CS063_13890 [Sporanaerobium hydrogeniformans]
MKGEIKQKKHIGKAILGISLGLLPLIGVTVVTFLNFNLSILPSILIGVGIGILIIPFFLIMTAKEGWNKKWYIWVELIFVVVLLFVIPFLKRGANESMGPDNPMNSMPKERGGATISVGMLE